MNGMSANSSAQALPQTFDLGDRTITLLTGGALRLDGGAMFGIIPKPLWSRRTPADEQNRIALACNCLLVETRGPAARRILIEVGHGPKYAEKEQRLYGIEPQHWLLPALRAARIEPETIDDVIVTHLHFDHAGGLTWHAQPPGERAGGPAPQPCVPTFARARVHVQRQEFDDARANFGIMHATYREENFAPIDAIGAWRLLEGEQEIVPGVRCLLSRGHTRGHHSIVIEGADRGAIYPGDVMPTAAHIGAPWNMGYDLLPIDNRESKQRVLTLAAQRDWLIFMDHEPRTPVATARREKDWFALNPV